MRECNTDPRITEQSVDPVPQVAGNRADIELVVDFKPVINAEEQGVGSKVFEVDRRFRILEDQVLFICRLLETRSAAQLVTAPRDADETSMAYFARTPRR